MLLYYEFCFLFCFVLFCFVLFCFVLFCFAKQEIIHFTWSTERRLKRCNEERMGHKSDWVNLVLFCMLYGKREKEREHGRCKFRNVQNAESGRQWCIWGMLMERSMDKWYGLHSHVLDCDSQLAENCMSSAPIAHIIQSSSVVKEPDTFSHNWTVYEQF